MSTDELIQEAEALTSQEPCVIPSVSSLVTNPALFVKSHVEILEGNYTRDVKEITEKRLIKFVAHFKNQKYGK